jgi:hypothetical protein
MTRKTVVWPPAPVDSDDDQVAYYPMLDLVPSTESFSSPSSSDSSGSKSIRASPPPIPDLFISMELLDIPEMPEAWAAQQTVSMATEAHAISMLMIFRAFVYFVCFVVLLLAVDLRIGFTGAHDGECADAGCHRQTSNEVVDGDDE